MKRCFLIVAVALASAPPPAAAQQTGGPTLQAPGASSFGAAPFAGAGAKVAVTQADRATNFGAVFDVKADFGAACDGVTDDAAAINAALQKASLQNRALRQGLVKIPRGKICRASATIVVPYYLTLDLGGYNPTTGVSPVPGGGIVCDAGVSPCVTLGVYNANAPTELVNGTVTHAGGTPDASVVNVMVYGYHATIRDVLSDNAGQCYKFAAHVGGAPGGIHAEVWNSSAQRCSDAYIDVSNWPELYWFGGRIGAAYDYPAKTYVRTENPNAAGPGAAGTVVFTATQFNSGASPGPLHFWEFVNANNPIPKIDSTNFQVIGGHIENLATGGGVFFSDSSVNQIGRVKMVGTTVNAPNVPLFALNPATGISDWDLPANLFFVAATTLAPSPGKDAIGIRNLRINGGTVLHPLTLTGISGSSAAISGATLAGLTVGGEWASFNAFGNIGCIANRISSGAFVIDDTCDGRSSSGAVSLGGALSARNGAPPSSSGSCPVTSLAGGQMAGSFKASGACSGGTVTLTFAAPQANGWACDAHDETTPKDLMNQTAHTKTSVTFAGAMAPGDTVFWKCVGF